MNGESWRGLAEWFWLRISHRVAVKITAMAAVIWRIISSWRICFHDGLTLRTGKLLASCCQESSISHHMDSSLGLLEMICNIATGFSQREWSKVTQMSTCLLWSSYEVTFFNFHCSLSVTPVSLIPFLEGPYQGLNITR